MGFLSRLLEYKRICIQCHNNPDADTTAAAFGVYCYLTNHGVDAFMVYGGREVIRKRNMLFLLSSCDIPLTHNTAPEGFDLLLMVDCQRGGGNTDFFEAERVAVIDHHVRITEPCEDYLIKTEYQSCSTIVWELLKEEGFPLEEYPMLSVALLYGLYTDTACFADLFAVPDNSMRIELYTGHPVFEQLIRTNLTVAELMVATDAMHNHYFDMDRHFSVVEALACDQTVLAVIGDFMIQVDVVYLSFAYTRSGGGYSISIRSCHENMPADRIAAYVCSGVGSGGGHAKKGGGYIEGEKMAQVFGGGRIFDFVCERLCSYIDENVTL